ncbi:MAG: carbohydrate binding family 9 domain-containing protein [Chitinophagales bacterium]|nr:carbohydrate binding family 9 domain-containing protein [Chitinophagales bacterium]
MKVTFTIILLFFIEITAVFGQKPTIEATRVNSPPKIDGALDEVCWQNVPIASNFITATPEYGKSASQRTETKIIYDDVAIYIGSYMYDSTPGKIKHQLSQRDNADALADHFVVGFDTYDDGINGYRFLVTAAGVQYDEKGSPSNDHDDSWDAVWQSAVSIKKDGWVCEIKIPYSAIRFPSKSLQNWGIQFGREIIRNGELSTWSPIDPKVAGRINQWGKLIGLENIHPPLRLSFSPYLTAGFQVSPTSYDPPEYVTDKLFGGGVDVKYGINESFTLDATLIPDFGQVQSDNIVLNISPFETKFNEKRPFFTEGTELFNQDNVNGNNNSPQVFYSRRIGGQPIYRFDVFNLAQDNETIIKNPSDSKLYNATKFSGRTDDGLGIGILNAVSRPSYAEIKNDETGTTRKIQTATVTNYNVFVLDQSLKHNSKISLENTNVWRSGSAPDANVTSSHFDFRDKENAWKLAGFANFSARFDGANGNTNGGYYNVNLNDIKGKFTEWVWHEVITPNYNQNDLGILYYSNQMTNGAGFNYYNQELKKGHFSSINFWTSINFKTQVVPLQYQEWEGNSGFSCQFKNFYQAQISIYTKPFWYYDYYEPRVAGRRYYSNPYAYLNFFLGTDYRKKLSLNGNLGYGDGAGPDNPFVDLSLNPKWTLNDHVQLSYSLYVSRDLGTKSYVDMDNSNIIFGARNTSTVSNTLSADYAFNPKMIFTFRARYYWSRVNWTKFYHLNENGSLGTTDFTGDYDINFNVFNIDAVFAWECAPGSFLNVIWKNNIFQSDDKGADNYYNNFTKTFSTPQTNGVSVKFIYYLDYQVLKRRQISNP